MAGIRGFFQTRLRSMGYEVRRIQTKDPDFRMVGFGWDTTPILDAGVRARTVIDAGTAGGTPPLYKLFPDAYYFMIEPLPHFIPEIKTLLRTMRGELIASALGAAAGELTINFNAATPVQSSLAERVGRMHETTKQRVRIDTLDSHLNGKQIDRPCVLKVDVEGYELDALRGAAATLKQVDAIIIEVASDAVYHHLDRNMRRVDDLLRNAGFGIEAIINATIKNGNQVRKADLLYTR